MSRIPVNLNRWTRCGLCARICPCVVHDINPQKGPPVIRDKGIACGHCVAVCPTQAINNRKSPRLKQPPAFGPVLDEKTAAVFLRSRRTIRWYQKRRVPREKVTKIRDMARFAPSGSNSQDVSWRVIDRPETIRAVSNAVLSWQKEELAPHASPLFEAQIQRHDGKNEDPILFNAPCASFTPSFTRQHLALGRAGQGSLKVASMQAGSRF